MYAYSIMTKWVSIAKYPKTKNKTKTSGADSNW